MASGSISKARTTGFSISYFQFLGDTDLYFFFHLPKNSGGDVNGTRLFGSFHWKFNGINGIPEK